MSSIWFPFALLALTLLVFAFETLWSPWKPIHVLGPLLLLSLPWMLIESPGRLFEVAEFPIGPFLFALISVLLLDHFFFGWLLETLSAKLEGTLGWGASIVQDTRRLMDMAQLQSKWPKWSIELSAGIYICLWAPIAEELFYWAYAFKALEKDLGVWASIGVVSFFFAARHSLQYLILRPLPWGTMVAIFVNTFLVGIVHGTLLHSTGSLPALIGVHLVTNWTWAAYQLRQAGPA